MFFGFSSIIKLCLFTGVIVIAMSSAFAAKNSASNSPIELSSTEQILKLNTNELEKRIGQLTEGQKVALKQIAFNPNSDLQVRWRALVVATRLMKNDMKPEIITASKSNEWFMRSASLMAAKEISSEEATMLARKLITDKALVVRSAAVDFLGSSGEESDRKILWKIIHDPLNSRKGQSLWIRSQALQILARNPYKQELKLFIDLLNDTDLELQAIAIQGLEKVSAFQFGTSNESIQDHRKRWLNWWQTMGKVEYKNLNQNRL